VTETYILKLPKRTATVTIDERKDRVILSVAFDRIGNFGDAKEISKWFGSLVAKYERDPRPLSMESPNSKEKVTLLNNGIGFYEYL
jgi:hypothetical protein